MRKKVFTFLLAALLLTGCHQKQNMEAFPVVTRIETVLEDSGHGQVYTGEAEMRPILNALRLLGHRYKPQADPDALNAPTRSVTLLYSDGSRHLYRIKGDHYIQEDLGPWRQTDPERLTALTALLDPSL